MLDGGVGHWQSHPVFAGQMRFIFLGLLLAGCAASRPERFRYKNLPPDLKIVRGTPAWVNKHCRKGAKRLGLEPHMDNGQPYPENALMLCCYYAETINKKGQAGRLKNVMLVSDNADRCVYHELCHAEGKPEAVCHQINVKDW